MSLAGIKRTWPLIRRVLTAAFFALVIAVVYALARDLDWRSVGAVLRELPRCTLALALVLAAGSFLIYSSFDLIGRRYTGHLLLPRQIVPVTFVCYAFNLNLGSLIGGFGFRLRLYSRLGLERDVIARLIGLSLATNWLGYLVAAGVVFALRLVSPPEAWRLDTTALQVLGVVMLAVAAGYLSVCGLARRRTFDVYGHHIVLPRLDIALAQMLLGTLNWVLIGGVMWALLQQRIAYTEVLGVLLVAAIAGVLAHIPAGLGVLEAVFIALLQDRLPRPELLAALIAYRAVYYLLPLLLAALVYLVLELRAKTMMKHSFAHAERRRVPRPHA